MSREPAKTLSVLLVRGRLRESDALVDRLEREEGIKLSTCTANVISAAAEAKPDVIVLGIDGSDTNGFETAGAIRRSHARCRVMFIGDRPGDRTIQAALDAGAMAFLTRQEPPSAVVAAVREIANGRAVFSERVRERLVVSGEDASRLESRKSLLTPRELEIVRHIAQGLTDKEIAIRAKISPKTVESHCAHIRNKLGVRGRVAIVRFAFREGLASIGNGCVEVPSA